jgi:dephospho-CoA kinase
MIFLTGHRASGKTTVGKILSDLNFWMLDTGPYWRSLRESEYPSLDVDLYFERKRIQTGDPNWEDNHLAHKIKEDYAREYRTKQDIVVSGYRSLVEATHLSNLVGNDIFPNRRTQIWYVDCPFNISLARYLNRDGVNASRDQLLTQYEYEYAKGIKDMESVSDIRLDNSKGEDYLRAQVLNYLSIEGYVTSKERTL